MSANEPLRPPSNANGAADSPAKYALVVYDAETIEAYECGISTSYWAASTTSASTGSPSAMSTTRPS